MIGDGIYCILDITIVDFVATTFDLHELRIRYRSRKCLAVRQRENRIGRAMNDEKRHFHLIQPVSPISKRMLWLVALR